MGHLRVLHLRFACGCYTAAVVLPSKMVVGVFLVLHVQSCVVSCGCCAAVDDGSSFLVGAVLL